MPSSEYVFPVRVTKDCLFKAYASLEAAFAAHDYLYVARFGKDNPELHGCSLLMLGNRVGGECILDRHHIETGRSYLYRAYVAWQDDQPNEIQRWVEAARKAGGVDAKLDRFSELINRKSFTIMIYGGENQWDVSTELKKLPWIEVVKGNPSPSGEKPKGQVPIDLVLAHDLAVSKDNLNANGAPVITTTGDHEWFYDQLDVMLQKVDWVTTPCTTEALEMTYPFGRQFLFSGYLWTQNSKNLSESFADKTSRAIDLLFTGGLTHDFYRDKRQRVLPLGYKLDKRFNVKLMQKSFPFSVYEQLLRSSRFTVVSTRMSNHMSSRNIEALSMGVINLVNEANGMPFLFSEPFACFQTYSHENSAAEIEAHMRRYDEIIEDFKPQVKQFETEFCCLFPAKEIWWTRYVKRWLFVTHMEGKNKRLPHKDKPKKITAGDWLRRAVMCSQKPVPDPKAVMSSIEEGLSSFPSSLPLHYSRALLLRNAGRWAEAEDIFQRIAQGDFVVETDDPFPHQWDTLQGLYWVMDARIRARSPDKLAPLVPEKAVWQSFSLAHLADLALPTVPDAPGEQKVKALTAVATLAKQSIDLLVHNDTAQRMYLRAAYRLYALGQKEWSEIFLKSFETAQGIDGRIFSDFAPMVIDLLMQTNRSKEAEEMTEKLKLFLSRVDLNRQQFYLYPEVMPLLVKYNLPHGALMKM